MNGNITAVVHPAGSLDILSQREVAIMANSELHELFRQCALAVLNTGSESDDCNSIMQQFHDFDVEVHETDRGIKLKVINAPGAAFVDGKMIQGLQEHLFSVLRDLVYSHQQIFNSDVFDLETSNGITNANFHMLRNAGVVYPVEQLRLVVCWGGHAINRVEYDYTKDVGYELGLRGLDICTGCGPGAMKGPMKGATVGHAKQRIDSSRFIGISEPGIIAAEAPNPIVNRLLIMPDIEKRLESFVRLGHAIVIFPGGVGTAEELLYLLGLLLHPDNIKMPLPLVFTGPAESEQYLHEIETFVKVTLGDQALSKIRFICGDPEEVAIHVQAGIHDVKQFRRDHSDAYYFNWVMNIPLDFQRPFKATHENMSRLNLTKDQPVHQLAANLRRAFSGIVAGNIKSDGVKAIEQFGPFKLKGDRAIMDALDKLLAAFVAQRRMKIGEQQYNPCYQLV